MSGRRLALLDWDNTLRSGFTITGWTEFLTSRGQYDHIVAKRTISLMESYSQHLIGYAELSEAVASLYAEGLAGQAVSLIRESATDFVRQDNRNLFGFTTRFLAMLANEKINTYIVSGCPSEVLAAYWPMLRWTAHYGLEADIHDGLYTGLVAADRASIKGKQVAVNKIIGQGRALLAAGDSVSDLPLLENAHIRLIFDNPQLLQTEPRVYHLDPSRPAIEILKAVRRALWAQI